MWGDQSPMELSSVDHAPPNASRPRTCPRSCPSKNVDLGNAFKCLEEGIQAIHWEHTTAESWISGLRQEFQKATDEILASSQRMGSKLNECHALLNDVMEKSSSQPQDLQRNDSEGEDLRKVEINEVESIQFERRKAPSTDDAAKTKDIVDLLKRSRNSPGPEFLDPHACFTVHTALLEKMEDQHRRQQEYQNMVTSRCQWYHSHVPSQLVSLIHSGPFNNFCALITVAFAILVGIEANTNIRAALYGKSVPAWIHTVVNCFNCWFVAEVLLRLLASGVFYFVTPNWRWHIFDMVIAALSLVDMFANIGTFGFMRVLRALKIAKALRVVGLLSLLHDLRLIVASMLASLMSLLWSLIFLAMIVYLAAVSFVDAAAHYLQERKDHEVSEEVKRDLIAMYDSLGNAMYTLLQCITGGADWADGARPMWHLGLAYGNGFVCYILFCLFGILNVMTSVFVEHASNVKSEDRDYAVSQELRQMEREVEETMDLFDTLVESGSHEITIDGLEDFLSHERVTAHFASLGIVVSDPSFVSHVLGDTDAGCIDIRSFVRGCISLRGPAKQSDTLAIISRLKKLETVLLTLMQDTAQDFKLMAELAKRSKFSSGDDRQFPHGQNFATPQHGCSQGFARAVATIDKRLANMEADEAIDASKDDEVSPHRSVGLTGNLKL